MKWNSFSPQDTQDLGRRLLETFPDASMICLTGDLGSGKTAFAKGIGEALGIPVDSIKSPTFVTLFEHQGHKRLQHFDFYRVEDPDDFSVEWWNELVSRDDAISVVEWPDRVAAHLPTHRLEIFFERFSDFQRRLTLHCL